MTQESEQNQLPRHMEEKAVSTPESEVGSKTDNDKVESVETPEAQERVIECITNLINQRIGDAFKVYDDYIKLGTPKKFVDCIKEIWPENNGSPYSGNLRLYLPKLPIPEDIAKNFSIRFTVKPDDYENHASLDSGGVLSIGINEESTSQDAKITERLIKMHVYHEIEHIYFPGPNADFLDLSDAKDALKYVSDPGEIRAFAKGYAYLFKTKFPGEAFSQEKMSEAINEVGYRDWFATFSDSEKRKKYLELCGVDIFDINDQLIGLTSGFIGNIA